MGTMIKTIILHVYPVDDVMDHCLQCGETNGTFDDGTDLNITYCKCKCQPVMHYEGDDVLIVVHNSYDGREGLEWVNEILNS